PELGAAAVPDAAIAPVGPAGAEGGACRTAQCGTDGVAIAAAEIDPEGNRIGLRPNVVRIGLHDIDRTVVIDRGVVVLLVLGAPAMCRRPWRRVGEHRRGQNWR